MVLPETNKIKSIKTYLVRWAVRRLLPPVFDLAK